MRSSLLWLVTVVVLVAVNVSIARKEWVIEHGTTMLLELRQHSPRSLIQGDYMALRYKLPPSLDWRDKAVPRDGRVVVRLGPNGVAAVQRFHSTDRPLAQHERLLRYRKRGRRIRLGADAFFCQEGRAKRYEAARYGELRVDRSGNCVLVGLRDQNREPIRENVAKLLEGAR